MTDNLAAEVKFSDELREDVIRITSYDPDKTE